MVGCENLLYLCGMEKRKVGRPKEGLESLPKDWYKEILELYKIGGSDEEVKGVICDWRGSFSNDLWDRWLIEEPEFSETIKMGKMLSAAWWYRNGRENLKDREFNYTGWYMQMKNRFGWTDKTQVEQNSNIKIQPVDPFAKIRENNDINSETETGVKSAD